MKNYTLTVTVLADADDVIIGKSYTADLSTCQSKLKACKDTFGMALLHAKIIDSKSVIFSTKPNRHEDAMAWVRGWGRDVDSSVDLLNGVFR